jgi:hypothetical protein
MRVNHGKPSNKFWGIRLDQATCIYFMIRSYHHFFVHFAIKPVVLPPNWMFPSCGTYNVHQLMFINIWVPKITRPELGQTRYSPPWFSGCVGQYEQMVKFPLGGCACSPKHTSPSRTDAGSLVKSPSVWIVSFLVLFKQGYWRKIVRICKKWSWTQISEATKASQNLGSDWQQKTFSEALISLGEKIIGTELSMVHSDSRG